MTVQTKTYTVVLDASNNPEPLNLVGAAVGYVTTRWVVVNNLTPYIMLLDGVGDSTVNQAALAPGTANKYPWTQKNGPLTAAWVNPVTGPPPTSPQVIVEYSDDATGAELRGTYPTTLQSGIAIGTLTGSVTLTGPVTIENVAGGVLTTGGVADDLFNGSRNFNANTGVSFTGPLNSLNSYSAIKVGCTAPSSGVGAQIQMQVITTDASNRSTWWPIQTLTLLDSGLPSGSGATATFLFPVGIVKGDTVSVELITTSGAFAAGAGLQLQVYGLSDSPGVEITNPPSYPLETYRVGGAGGAGVLVPSIGSRAVVLGAPPPGFCYAIHNVIVDVSGTVVYWVDLAGGGKVIGVTGFGTGCLFGQLCFGGLDIQTIATNGGTAYVTADLIPIPNIQ